MLFDRESLRRPIQLIGLVTLGGLFLTGFSCSEAALIGAKAASSVSSAPDANTPPFCGEWRVNRFCVDLRVIDSQDAPATGVIVRCEDDRMELGTTDLDGTTCVRIHHLCSEPCGCRGCEALGLVDAAGDPLEYTTVRRTDSEMLLRLLTPVSDESSEASRSLAQDSGGQR